MGVSASRDGDSRNHVGEGTSNSGLFGFGKMANSIISESEFSEPASMNVSSDLESLSSTAKSYDVNYQRGKEHKIKPLESEIVYHSIH